MKPKIFLAFFAFLLGCLPSSEAAQVFLCRYGLQGDAAVVNSGCVTIMIQGVKDPAAGSVSVPLSPKTLPQSPNSNANDFDCYFDVPNNNVVCTFFGTKVMINEPKK